MAKRKKRGQNLSIHQFDEATQKQIEETVEQERQALVHSTPNMVEDHFTKKDDDINDRAQDEPVTPYDDDNILRASTEAQPEQLESPESPLSPLSPLDQPLQPKFDQVSVEIEQIEKIEKRQDYTLINKLFAFLDRPAASDDPKEGLNSTLCGYFSKVIQIMISCDPLELMKYFQQNNYEVFDKMLVHLDNKSICELFIKMMSEILKAPGPTNPLAQSELQQSGQSGGPSKQESIEKKMETPKVKRVAQILETILETKFGEDADFLQMLGA